MTPVTHARLTAKAAPGQLTAAELVGLRKAQGLEAPALRFAIFGSPVGKSPSPAMHNAAFAAHLLPHGCAAAVPRRCFPVCLVPCTFCSH